MFYHSTKIKDLAHEENGSILVLVALSLSVLLGLSALVTDLGVIYVNYAQLQNALDATVLAGAQELPNSTTQAQQVAEQYATRNGVPEVTIGFAQNNLEISASAQKKVPALFSKIFGLTENTITASSRAIMLPPSSLTGVVPLSVKEQNLSYGTEYFLKSGAGGDVDAGWYGALELDGPGAWDYQKFLTYGYSGNLSIGQVLQVEHGNMSGPTQKAIEDRLATDTRTPRNTFNNHERNAPEIVYVPIIRILSISGNSVQQVMIVGFAAFFIEGVTGNGTESIIQGRFLQTIVVNGQSTGSLAELQQNEANLEQGILSSDFGLYAPKLLS